MVLLHDNSMNRITTKDVIYKETRLSTMRTLLTTVVIFQLELNWLYDSKFCGLVRLLKSFVVMKCAFVSYWIIHKRPQSDHWKASHLIVFFIIYKNITNHLWWKAPLDCKICANCVLSFLNCFAKYSEVQSILKNEYK